MFEDEALLKFRSQLIHILGTISVEELSLSAEHKLHQTYLCLYTIAKLLCILLDFLSIDNTARLTIHKHSEKI